MRIEPGDMDLHKVFGVQLYLLANAGWRARLRLVLRALVSVFGKRPVPPPDGHGILFFNSSQRDDYVRLFQKAFDSCRQSKLRWQLRLVWGFNAEAFLLFFSELSHWRVVTVGGGNSLAARLFLYLLWVRCRQVGNLAERLSYTAVAVVCDIQLIESFLVQVANRRGLPTVTCQHGLYIDDGPDLLKGNLNPANYLNISSRYFLAWGEQTKALIEKYRGAVCIVVGNPTIPDAHRTQHADYFYVLTDADNRFRIYNERLLEIAAQVSARNGLRYFVRFHPDNDPRTYGNQPQADETFPLENAAFAIGHMTSQIFKAMRQGVPVYRLASSVAIHPVPQQLLFSSAEEILAKSVRSEVFESTAKHYIASIGRQSMANYARAFDMVVSALAAGGGHTVPVAGSSRP